MSYHEEKEAIELSIVQAKEQIALAEAVKRLETNPDFLRVVGEEFLKREAIRMLDMSNDPRMPAEFRVCMERDIHAPATFKRFMEATVRAGEAARIALEDAEEALDEIHDYEAGAVTTGAVDDEE